MPAKSIYAVESAAPLPDPDALRSVKVGELNRLTMAGSTGFDLLAHVDDCTVEDLLREEFSRDGWTRIAGKAQLGET